MAALAVALVGCKVEGGDKGAARAPSLPGATAQGAAMPGVSHSVFNRRREVIAPGLERLTVSAIVRMDAGPDSALKVIANLMAEARRSDSTVAAIRVLGYLPPPANHGGAASGASQMALVPLAFSDWAPEPGFDSLSVATRNHTYRTETKFVHDAATLRAMGLEGGVGPLRPGIPRGAVPPGHPGTVRP